MREIEKHEPVEIVEEKQEERKEMPIGSALLKRGHTCFQIDLLNGDITPAIFEIVAADYMAASKGQLVGHRKVVMKENCLYFNALNKKSVIKQYTNLMKYATKTN